MAFTRTTTINAAPGGDSTKQAVLDLDTDLTGAFTHLNTLDTTKLASATAATTYAPIAKGVTNGDSHDHSGGDGAQIAYSGLSGLPTLGTMSAQNTGTYAGPGSSQAFSVGALTATGINSTPIGSTTPSTGAFTTLSAVGATHTFQATDLVSGDVNILSHGSGAWFKAKTTNATKWGGFRVIDTVGAEILSLFTGGTNGALQISIGGTERARINYTGNALFGTTVDDGVNKLQVAGSIKATSSLYSNGGGGVASNSCTGFQALYNNTTGYNNTANGYQALFSNTTGSANTADGFMALYYNTTGSGNICIGSLTSAGDYAPVFNCTTENNRVVIGSTSVTNAYVNVAWTIVSDRRDKTNIVDIPVGLDFISQLTPVKYERKLDRDSIEGDGITRYGFIAQDVLAIEGDAPVIVDSENAEHLRINETSIIAVLVKAVQELKAEFEEYKVLHP